MDALGETCAVPVSASSPKLREAFASCALNGVPSSPASLLSEYLPIDLREEILPLFVSRFTQLELERSVALD
ncbi:uncharacterized [Tachysurus ichikawai]